MALRLLAVAAAALVFALSASAATPKHAVACLKAHHVLVAGKSPKTITRLGAHVVKLETFSFHGIPPKVFDNGSLVFEKTHAEAVQAQKTLYSRIAARQIKLSGGRVSPFRIRLNLRRTQVVVGNVVVLWSGYPQKLVAKRTLYACLR